MVELAEPESAQLAGLETQVALPGAALMERPVVELGTTEAAPVARLEAHAALPEVALVKRQEVELATAGLFASQVLAPCRNWVLMG